MQNPPPFPSAAVHYPQPAYVAVLATVAAVCAILALPFAFIPFLGLAGAALLLGFIAALALWTHRKRAIIGTVIACVAVIIAAVSSFFCVGAIIESRNAATAKMAQVQTQLEAMKAQAGNTSDRGVLSTLIKQLGGKDVSNEQANAIGTIGEALIRYFGSDDSNKTSEQPAQ